MKMQNVAIALTAINLVLLCVAMTRDAAPMLRCQALELVDEQGLVRSRLNVESDGEVVFRLFDQSGTIRFKLGAGEGGSGLLLLDETTEPAIHMIARRATSGISITSAAGQRVIAP